jgi:hypothetical protein
MSMPTHGEAARKLLLTPNERCWGFVKLCYAPAHSPRPYDHCCWGRYCCHDVLTVWLCSVAFEATRYGLNIYAKGLQQCCR